MPETIGGHERIEGVWVRAPEYVDMSPVQVTSRELMLRHAAEVIFNKWVADESIDSLITPEAVALREAIDRVLVHCSQFVDNPTNRSRTVEALASVLRDFGRLDPQEPPAMMRSAYSGRCAHSPGNLTVFRCALRCGLWSA